MQAGLDALDEAGALKKSGMQFEDLGDWEGAKTLYMNAASKIIEAKKSVPKDRHHLFQEPLKDIIDRAEAVSNKAKAGSASSSSRLSPKPEAIPLDLPQPVVQTSVSCAIELEKGMESLRGKDYVKASAHLAEAYDRLQHTNPGKAKEVADIMAIMANMHISDNPVAEKVATLTDAEKEVLKRSSRIGGKIFLPWADSDQIIDRTVTAPMFNDPDGFLTLATKQEKHFAKWSRESKEMNHEQKFLCTDLSAGNVMQTIVGDCSFVSALAVCCYWEYRFPGKKLVTHNIFPQDPQKRPLVNAKGQYVVRLFVNGIWRKVVVDDFFPVDKHDRLLTSLSKNGDKWVSIYEKAFLKVHGGYHFPGSITSFDIYALTGWPPEEISLQTTPQPGLWNILTQGKGKGQCVVAAGTRSMSPEQEEACGLSSSHAYAILEVGVFEGYKLLLLKNPWSSKRWRGKFSPEDRTSWTATLKKQLKFDDLTSDVDRGLFWMDLDSLCQHFSHLSLNWNANLFPYQIDRHLGWPLSAETEPYSMGGNPQLAITVEYGKLPAIIWFVTSQHSIDLNDDETQDFLGMHLYQVQRPGMRIYHMRKALVSGTYTNSPHEALKFQPTPKDGTHFTLVPSRNCSRKPKKQMLDFSIRIFSTVPITVNWIPEKWRIVKRVAGAWKGESAGGSCSEPTFGNNPQYVVKFLDRARLGHLRCIVSTDYHINAACHIIKNEGMRKVPKLYHDVCLYNCPHWKGRYCVSELFDVQQDVQIIACTEQSGQEAPFTIDFESTVAIEVVAL